MKTGRNARRLRLLVAIFALMSLMEVAPATTPAGTPHNQIETIRVGNVAFELVRIRAGSFAMGSATGDSDEKPIHEVRIGQDLYLGRTEITVRQFRAFVGATGYKTDAEQVGWANTCPQPGLHPNERGLDWRRPGFELNDDQPVVVVSWNDAMAFCRWLSAQTGRNVRLPTEAEWEYAARAGARDRSPSRLDEVAWYEDNASNCVRPVGTKRPNPWGLVDMQGNAWEWCLDIWRPDYREAAPDGRAQMCDPIVPQVVWRHVLRGGSWFTPARQLSPTYRARYLNHFSRPDTGFRIVLTTAATTDAAATAPVRGDTERHGSCTYDSRKGRTILEAHGARFEFARIPAGEFLMGGTDGIEKPAHMVRIGYDFEMGTTEVTVGQFRAFIKATDYPTDGEKVGVSWSRGPDTDWQFGDAVPWCQATQDQSDEHPAIFISWYDAMTFCHWLSAETGQEIRLPSEAEWEHACRAGTTGLYAGELSEMGWYNYNACNRTHPVAQKQPNAWGLYDMHGNVWEWCLDFFQPNYDGAPTDGQPRREVRNASDVVSRGGSFRNPSGWVASGCRMGTFPDASHGNNGFRLVRVLKKDAGAKLVPLEIELPRPVFVGVPSYCFRPSDLEKPLGRPRPPLLVPPGTTNLARGKPVTCGYGEPLKGSLTMITDGNKEAGDDSVVELGPAMPSRKRPG
jgi:formylglycine-generating enzyme required for sulfatase activity